MTDSTTDAWLRRLQQGNPSALSELFEHYRPKLRQTVQLRMSDQLLARVDPSDVLQEAYLDVSQRIERYLANPTVTIYVWLRGQALDRLWKVQRQHLGAGCRAAGRESRLPDDASAALALQLLDRGPSPSAPLLAKELRRLVQMALDRLSDDDREVILMRHFEGMTNTEVAESLGLTTSGATMRHGRALFRLKELLQRDLQSGEHRS